jgi:hypothetical protein
LRTPGCVSDRATVPRADVVAIILIRFSLNLLGAAIALDSGLYVVSAITQDVGKMRSIALPFYVGGCA